MSKPAQEGAAALEAAAAAPSLLADPAAVARALGRLETSSGWVDAYFERTEMLEVALARGLPLAPPGESGDGRYEFDGDGDGTPATNESDERLARLREEGLAVRLVEQGSWLASRDAIGGRELAEACRQVARVAPRVPIHPPEELAVAWPAGGSGAVDVWQPLRSFPPRLLAELERLRVAFDCVLRLRRFDKVSQCVSAMLSAPAELESFHALEVRSRQGSWGTLLLQLDEQALRETAGRLAAWVHARRAPPPAAGRRPVVLGPGATAVLLHEAVAHALEADLLALSGTPAAACGVAFAAPMVDVLDDPSAAPSTVARAFDDEGSPTERRWLLRGGVVEAPIADRTWALGEQGLEPGAGWRGDRHCLPLPRSRHLELLAGEQSVESMLAAATGGLYVDELSGGRLDPLSGRIRLLAPHARSIGSGGLAERHGPLQLVGLAAAVLSSIAAVGAERRAGGAGWCAKGGQRLPVWARAPGVLIEAIEVEPWA